MMNKNNKKIPLPFIFLLLICILYFILSFFNINLVINALINTGKMTLKIIPILIFVFIFSIFINLYLKNDTIKKHLGENSGIKGLLYAIIGGILISGPPYILYPMLNKLKKSGVKNSLIAIFLYNRNIKIPYIPVMIFYFGLSYTIIISIYILIFSILNGFLINLFIKETNEN